MECSFISELIAPRTRGARKGKQAQPQAQYIPEPLDPLIRIDTFIASLAEWRDASTRESLSVLLLSDISKELVKLRQQNLLHTIPDGDLQTLVSVIHIQIQQSSKSVLKFSESSVCLPPLSNSYFLTA